MEGGDNYTSRRLVRVLLEARLALISPELLARMADAGQGSTLGRTEACGQRRCLAGARPSTHLLAAYICSSTNGNIFLTNSK